MREVYGDEALVACEQALPPGKVLQLSFGRRRRLWRINHDELLAGLHETEDAPGHELHVLVATQILTHLLQLIELALQVIDLGLDLVFMVNDAIRVDYVMSGRERQVARGDDNRNEKNSAR